MFIVIEGIDGSGKSIQVKKLYNYLKKTNNCFLTKEPTNSKIGLFINSLIKKHQINSDTIELSTINNKQNQAFVIK